MHLPVYLMSPFYDLAVSPNAINAFLLDSEIRMFTCRTSFLSALRKKMRAERKRILRYKEAS